MGLLDLQHSGPSVGFFDQRYLLESNNLSDLTDPSAARTNLGLVAGGAGDIWVEKAGDTMTGDLTLDNSNNIILGNTTTKAGQITMFANTTGATATINAGPVYALAGENGIQIERLLLTAGRFDFDPDGGKAEMRVDGAATIFNIFNKGSFVTMFSANSTGVLLGGNGSQTPDEKLSIIGNFNVKDADTATKQYRFRTNGGSLDFEGAGSGLVFSVWSNADFTGTQYNYYHARNNGQFEAFGNWEWKGGLFQGVRHNIRGTTDPVVFNEGAEDIDFRIEGDTAPNLFHTDASADTVYMGGTTTRIATDSGGNTSWEGEGSGLLFGNMYMYQGSTTVTVSVVDTWYELASGLTGGETNGVTFQNTHELLVSKAGKYLVNWSMSLDTPTAADEVMGAVGVNGTVNTSTASHTTVGNNDQGVAVAGTGILDLAADDVVSMFVLNETNTNNITVEHVTLTIMQIGGT